MTIPHRAPFANGARPIYAGEGIGASGEPFEPFEYIGERLAVLAVAARIMARRHPRDVYACTIARESERLALAVRAAHRAARIVDAAPEAPEAPDAPPSPATEATPQAMPEAASLAGDGTQRTPAAQAPRPRHRSPQGSQEGKGPQGSKVERHA